MSGPSQSWPCPRLGRSSSPGTWTLPGPSHLPPCWLELGVGLLTDGDTEAQGHCSVPGAVGRGEMRPWVRPPGLDLPCFGPCRPAGLTSRFPRKVGPQEPPPLPAWREPGRGSRQHQVVAVGTGTPVSPPVRGEGCVEGWGAGPGHRQAWRRWEPSRSSALTPQGTSCPALHTPGCGSSRPGCTCGPFPTHLPALGPGPVFQPERGADALAGGPCPRTLSTRGPFWGS